MRGGTQARDAGVLPHPPGLPRPRPPHGGPPAGGGPGSLCRGARPGGASWHRHRPRPRPRTGNPGPHVGLRAGGQRRRRRAERHGTERHGSAPHGLQRDPDRAAHRGGLAARPHGRPRTGSFAASSPTRHPAPPGKPNPPARPGTPGHAPAPPPTAAPSRGVGRGLRRDPRAGHTHLTSLPRGQVPRPPPRAPPRSCRRQTPAPRGLGGAGGRDPGPAVGSATQGRSEDPPGAWPPPATPRAHR